MSDYNETGSGGIVAASSGVVYTCFIIDGSAGIVAGGFTLSAEENVVDANYDLTIDLLSLQTMAANSIVVSESIDVSNKMMITIFVSYCQIENDADITSAPIFRIECKYTDLPQFWFPVTSWQPKTIAPVSDNITGTNHVGTLILNVADIPSGWLAGQLSFIYHELADATDLSKSEFVRIRTLDEDNLLVNLQYPTTLNHTKSTNNTPQLFNSAEKWAHQVNVAAITKLRLVIDGSACDKQIAISSFVTSTHIS